MSARTRRGKAVFTDIQETDDFSLETSYQEAFVERLKEMVGPQYRGYDSENQAWIIDYDFFKPVIRLVSEYFGEVVVRDPSNKYVYSVTWPDEDSLY